MSLSRVRTVDKAGRWRERERGMTSCRGSQAGLKPGPSRTIASFYGMHDLTAKPHRHPKCTHFDAGSDSHIYFGQKLI